MYRGQTITTVPAANSYKCRICGQSYPNVHAFVLHVGLDGKAACKVAAALRVSGK